MNRILVKAVIEAFVFAGLSSEEVLNLDAAVAHMEQLAAILKQLDANERKSLADQIEAIALEEEGKKGRTERVDFIRSLVESMGLLD